MKGHARGHKGSLDAATHALAATGVRSDFIGVAVAGQSRMRCKCAWRCNESMRVFCCGAQNAGQLFDVAMGLDRRVLSICMASVCTLYGMVVCKFAGCGRSLCKRWTAIRSPAQSDLQAHHRSKLRTEIGVISCGRQSSAVLTGASGCLGSTARS
jgi:hypothetical protein